MIRRRERRKINKEKIPFIQGFGLRSRNIASQIKLFSLPVAYKLPFASNLY